eukprot:TRINITY_DN44092_c0_g2_i1.p1 TRINITY_DN44092_c0_g2~~TRINITY_DN44092_c0_g2_i1.p1  ORF type:complete len:1103 (-),score=354.81 TRINITY_DN44092_c0_g2_i1:12-3320(-)
MPAPVAAAARAPHAPDAQELKRVYKVLKELYTAAANSEAQKVQLSANDLKPVLAAFKSSAENDFKEAALELELHLTGAGGKLEVPRTSLQKWLGLLARHIKHLTAAVAAAKQAEGAAAAARSRGQQGKAGGQASDAAAATRAPPAEPKVAPKPMSREQAAKAELLAAVRREASLRFEVEACIMEARSETAAAAQKQAEVAKVCRDIGAVREKLSNERTRWATEAADEDGAVEAARQRCSSFIADLQESRSELAKERLALETARAAHGDMVADKLDAAAALEKSAWQLRQALLASQAALSATQREERRVRQSARQVKKLNKELAGAEALDVESAFAGASVSQLAAQFLSARQECSDLRADLSASEVVADKLHRALDDLGPRLHGDRRLSRQALGLRSQLETSQQRLRKLETLQGVAGKSDSSALPTVLSTALSCLDDAVWDTTQGWAQLDCAHIDAEIAGFVGRALAADGTQGPHKPKAAETAGGAVGSRAPRRSGEAGRLLAELQADAGSQEARLAEVRGRIGLLLETLGSVSACRQRVEQSCSWEAVRLATLQKTQAHLEASQRQGGELATSPEGQLLAQGASQAPVAATADTVMQQLRAAVVDDGHLQGAFKDLVDAEGVAEDAASVVLCAASLGCADVEDAAAAADAAAIAQVVPGAAGGQLVDLRSELYQLQDEVSKATASLLSSSRTKSWSLPSLPRRRAEGDPDCVPKLSGGDEERTFVRPVSMAGCFYGVEGASDMWCSATKRRATSSAIMRSEKELQCWQLELQAAQFACAAAEGQSRSIGSDRLQAELKAAEAELRDSKQERDKLKKDVSTQEAQLKLLEVRQRQSDGKEEALVARRQEQVAAEGQAEAELAQLTALCSRREQLITLHKQADEEASTWKAQQQKLQRERDLQATSRSSEEQVFRKEVQALRNDLRDEEKKLNDASRTSKAVENSAAAELEKDRKEEEAVAKALQAQREKAAQKEESLRRSQAELEAKLVERREALLRQQEEMRAKHLQFMEQKTSLEEQARVVNGFIRKAREAASAAKQAAATAGAASAADPSQRLAASEADHTAAAVAAASGVGSVQEPAAKVARIDRPAGEAPAAGVGEIG